MSVSTFNYNPKMANPNMFVNITPTRSDGFQAPFFFGGSQVPYNLGITKQPKMSGGAIKKHKFTTLQQSDTRQLTAIPHSMSFRK